MSRPVIAYHIVFGAYGFWLPNDPRGSWSRYVGSRAFRPFGPPQPVRPDTSLTLEDARRLGEMRATLKYPAVRFSQQQTATIAASFEEILRRLRLVVYAAAIMPDHVHVIAARQEMYSEEIIGHLKRAASRRLRHEHQHPLGAYESREGRLPTPWAEHGWHLFLYTLDDLEHAIVYVQNNPIEAGLLPQEWTWTRRYEG